jgi:hypothetical protein
MRQEVPGREYAYALLAFLSLGCANAVKASDEHTAEKASEIIGGIQTDLRPEIFEGFRNGFHCTGTLVHKRFALTAAHCVNATGPINPTIAIMMNGRGYPMDWAYRLGSQHVGQCFWRHRARG